MPRNEDHSNSSIVDSLSSTENSRHFDILIQTQGVLILGLNRQGRITLFNKGCEAVTGYTSSEVKGKSFFSLLIPEKQRASVRRTFKRLIAGQTPVLRVHTWVTKTGEERFIQWHYTVITNANGTLREVLVIGLDVTMRERAEEAYRAIVDRSRQGLLIFQDGHFVFANRAFVRMLGYTSYELIALTTEEVKGLLYPDDREQVWGHLVKRAGGQRAPSTFECRFLRKDGTIRWFEVSSSRIEYRGKPAVQATLMDITRRKRAEAELERVNRALRTLSECNQAIVHAQMEPDLLDAICQILVEVGGYRFAWVGFAKHDEDKTVSLVAKAGDEEGYLDTMNISWADTPQGRTPTGTAIRTSKLTVARNILSDPANAPLRSEAIQWGYSSIIALPLIKNKQTLGALTIYAVEPEAFDREERKLLKELSDDLAYGIIALRTRVDHQRAEEALRASEEQYRLHFENVSDVIFALDNQLKLISISPSVERILGYRPDQLIGKYYQDLKILTSESYEKGTTELKRLLKGEMILDREYEFVAKDGTSVFGEVSATPLIRNGKVIQIIAIARDITARKLAEQEVVWHNTIMEAINRVLQETLVCETEEEVARTCLAVAEELTDSQFGYVGEVNPDGRYDTIAISDPGWTACQMPETRAVKLLKDMEIRSYWGRVLQEGKPVIVNDPATDPDRRGVPKDHPPITAFLGVPLERAGKTFGMIGLANKEGGYELADQQAVERLAVPFVEALDRKRAETALRESEMRFRQFFENELEYCYMISLEGIILDVNRAALKALGYKKEELVGQPLKTIYAPESLPKIKQLFVQWKRTGDVRDEEMVIVTRARERRTVLLRVTAVRDKDGRLLHSVSVQKDITERKRAEAALMESEARYQRFFENIPIGLYRTTPDGHILDANPALVEMLAYPDKESLLQVKASDVYVNPVDRKRFSKRVEEESVIRGVEMPFYRADGKIIWVQDSARIVRDADGQVRYFEGSLEDITGRKQGEQELMEARRRAEFLVDLIGHDITNINQGLISALEIMLFNPDMPQPFHDQLKMALSQVERSAQLIANVKRFTALDEPPPALGKRDLYLALMAAAEAANRAFPGKTLQLKTKLRQGEQYVIANGFLIEIFFNLLHNALKFDSNKRVRVDVTVGPSRRKGFVKIQVKDHGPGVSDEEKEKILSRFIEGEPIVHGSGIGLALVRQLVERYGGRILVSDRIKGDYTRGANFIIELPRG